MNIILWFVVKSIEEVKQYKQEKSCFGTQARHNDDLDEEVEEDTRKKCKELRDSLKIKIHRSC